MARPFARDRIVVCDCYTLFVGYMGPPEGANSILLSLFLGAEPGAYLGLTTTAELERGKEMVEEHASRRPDKVSDAAATWVLKRLDVLAAGGFANFQVRTHPTVSALASDDHMVLLSAAAAWQAGFMTARNPDVLGINEFRGVKLRRPQEILDELPDADDVGVP